MKHSLFSTDKPTSIPRSKRNLVLIIAAFILPVILAKLALEQHWFTYGVTNKGQLLAGQITLKQMGLDSEDYDHKWLLIYLLPKKCDESCQQLSHHVNNTYVALGKEIPRVIPLALSSTNLSTETTKQLANKQWRTQIMPAQTEALFTPPQVLIVDPLGNVVLAHQINQEQQSLLTFGKAILADFKKLLKYSKVG
jgi:hypothetical protein